MAKKTNHHEGCKWKMDIEEFMTIVLHKMYIKFKFIS